MNPDERNELIDALLEGGVSEADFLRLQAEFTGNQAARHAYLDRVALTLALAQEAAALPSAGGRRSPALRLWRPWPRLAAAAALVLLGAVAFFFLAPRAPQPAAALLQPGAGGAEVIHLGRARLVETALALAEGDQVTLAASANPAAIRFADGTRITLQPGTWFLLHQFEAQKQVELCHGGLFAQVSPQPSDRPMKIRTPQGVATVLGTRLRLSVGLESTRMEVVEGAVRIGGSADAAEKIVSTGCSVVIGVAAAGAAAASSPSVGPARKLPDLPPGAAVDYDFATGRGPWYPTSETRWQADAAGAQGVMVLTGEAAYKLVGPEIAARAGDRLEITLRVLAENQAVLKARHYVFDDTFSNQPRKALAVPPLELPPVPRDGRFHEITFPVPVPAPPGGVVGSTALILYVYGKDGQPPQREDRVLVDFIRIRRL